MGELRMGCLASGSIFAAWEGHEQCGVEQYVEVYREKDSISLE